MRTENIEFKIWFNNNETKTEYHCSKDWNDWIQLFVYLYFFGSYLHEEKKYDEVRMPVSDAQ